MTHTETDKQWIESVEFNAPNELLELKKKVAEEIVNKLQEKDPDILSKIFTNYLVNDGTILDELSDNILWKLWEITWMISPDLKRYREMLNNANTKQEIENLKVNILSEIWSVQTSIDSRENSTTSDSTQNESTNTNKENSKKEEKLQDWLDKKKKTYTNTKTWLTFCIYDQNDPRRWNKKKNGGTTMNQTGCLLTSAAVIHSMIDPSITPDFYRQHYAGSFPYDSIPKATQHKLQSKVLLPGEKNKWTKEKTQRAITEIIKHLEKGYPVDFMVHWPKHGGNNTLTSWQHYMAAVDIRENNGKKEVFIANTHNNKWWGRFPVDKAFASLRQASLYTPTQA